MKLKFSQQIFEKYSNINFMKLSSVGARLFYVDRRTDMTKLTVAFRNFANEPKNGMKVLVHEDVCLAVQRLSDFNS
jgi:hypothetical protein